MKGDHPLLRRGIQIAIIGNHSIRLIDRTKQYDISPIYTYLKDYNIKRGNDISVVINDRGFLEIDSPPVFEYIEYRKLEINDGRYEKILLDYAKETNTLRKNTIKIENSIALLHKKDLIYSVDISEALLYGNSGVVIFNDRR